MNREVMKDSLVYGGILSAIALTVLTGNNYNLFEYNCDKAIVLEQNNALVIEVAKCVSYNKRQFKIETMDGKTIITNKDNTKLIDDKTDVELFIKSIKGENVNIKYLEKNNNKVLCLTNNK